MNVSYSINRLPRIRFGCGAIVDIPEILNAYGKQILFVTGSSSIDAKPAFAELLSCLRKRGFYWKRLSVVDEPSPDLVDDAVASYGNEGIEVVIGVGGGSALDAGKAIAGLLRVQRPVMDFLEGIGAGARYEGPATPYIAVPTTAGTGSEATMNAVLSVRSRTGFKKSFRDERLVPEYAIVDPDLLLHTPPTLLAANGMDALTQLLESYVSAKASPFTDAIVVSGLEAVARSLLLWYRGDTRDATRRDMAHASLVSGMALAQAGLGAVHGLASPLGALYPVPHGVCCGTLVAAATKVNVIALKAREPANPALSKYARAGEILCRANHRDSDSAIQALIDYLDRLTESLELPGLSTYGLHTTEIPDVVRRSRGGSMRSIRSTSATQSSRKSSCADYDCHDLSTRLLTRHLGAVRPPPQLLR